MYLSFRFRTSNPTTVKMAIMTLITEAAIAKFCSVLKSTVLARADGT